MPYDELEESSNAVITIEPPPARKPAEKKKPQGSTRTKTKTEPKTQPNYHVIIWNDEEHTYEYVIELLMVLFGHPFERAFQITDEVHHSGKGIAWTCHMELAELKRDQVLGFGADWRMPKVSHGAIRATIEPAPE